MPIKCYAGLLTFAENTQYINKRLCDKLANDHYFSQPFINEKKYKNVVI